MPSPKILAVASAIDLDSRYGCTPAWCRCRCGCERAAGAARRSAKVMIVIGSLRRKATPLEDA